MALGLGTSTLHDLVQQVAWSDNFLRHCIINASVAQYLAVLVYLCGHFTAHSRSTHSTAFLSGHWVGSLQWLFTHQHVEFIIFLLVLFCLNFCALDSGLRSSQLGFDSLQRSCSNGNGFALAQKVYTLHWQRAQALGHLEDWCKVRLTRVIIRLGLVIAFNFTSSIQLRKLKNKIGLNQGLKHGCTWWTTIFSHSWNHKFQLTNGCIAFNFIMVVKCSRRP